MSKVYSLFNLVSHQCIIYTNARSLRS